MKEYPEGPTLNVRHHPFQVETSRLQLALLLGAQKPPQDVAPAHEVVKLLGGQVALANQALEPLELLLRVPLVRTSLLEHLNVVLGVLVLETLS